MTKAKFLLLSTSVLLASVLMLSCSSDSPELPPPIYSFCIYSHEERCESGSFLFCTDGGVPGYNCPYVLQSSSSAGEPEQESSSSTDTESSGSLDSSGSSSSLDSSGSSSSLDSSSSSSSLNMSSSSYSSSSSQKPSISLDIPNSGHYTNSLSFAIPPETEQGIIRCEQNGSEPTLNSPLASGYELTLTATAVLRCAQFKNGIATDPSIMRTYIIGERRPQLPVFSIAADPVTFTSSGIYPPNGCSGTQPCYGASYWKDTTVLIYIDFFEAEAVHKWSYPAGLKIMGGWSRANPKRSVKINFKEKFGQKKLKYSLFPQYPNLTKFKGFALRNNGNNWDRDYIRDMLATTLTEGLGIDYQKGRYAIVYYNGKYYGIHNLRERSNEDYYDTNYDISDENLDLIKNLDSASVGSMDDYTNLMNWLESVTLDDRNLEELEKKIDLNNFTNYFQSQIYFDNRDWPGNNIKIWRTKSPPSKYKWFLYDVDFGFGTSAAGYGINTCTMMKLVTDDGTKGCSRTSDKWPIYPQKRPTLMLRRLLDNASYRNAFINRFSLLLATYYAPTRVNAQINTLMSSIPSAEITMDRNKWGYLTNDLSTIQSFANSRPNTMHNEIKSYFSLSSPVDFTLSVEGNGTVKVHNLPVLNGSATFKAYQEAPIELEAVGSNFNGWSDGEKMPKRIVKVTGPMTLRAVF